MNIGNNAANLDNKTGNLSNNAGNTSGITSEVKQLGNKSVLIVRPNQLGMNN